jgi:cytidine deaminase
MSDESARSSASTAAPSSPSIAATTTTVAALDADERALVASARAAREFAYAPYSRFPVGAALRTSAGVVVAGVNVENAAYPATLCAERVAVGAAVAQGHRAFTHIAVVGPRPGPCTPCGTCRQVLHEFGPDIVVLAAGDDNAVARLVLADDLLPGAFGPASLATP